MELMKSHVLEKYEEIDMANMSTNYIETEDEESDNSFEVKFKIYI